MPQFTLRHLFLLTSFFCLWFAVYSYWRHPMIFTLPYYVGIIGLFGCVLHGTKDETELVKRLRWLTLANFVFVVVGMCWSEVQFRSWTLAVFLTFLTGIFLQGTYLCIHCFILGVTTSRGRTVGFALLFLLFNFMVLGTSLGIMLPTLSHAR